MWSVNTNAQLVAVGVAVGRGSVSSRRRFNTQSGSFESGMELGNSPKIVVVLDGPAVTDARVPYCNTLMFTELGSCARDATTKYRRHNKMLSGVTPVFPSANARAAEEH